MTRARAMEILRSPAGQDPESDTAKRVLPIGRGAHVGVQLVENGGVCPIELCGAQLRVTTNGDGRSVAICPQCERRARAEKAGRLTPRSEFSSDAVRVVEKIVYVKGKPPHPCAGGCGAQLSGNKRTCDKCRALAKAKVRDERERARAVAREAKEREKRIARAKRLRELADQIENGEPAPKPRKQSKPRAGYVYPPRLCTSCRNHYQPGGPRGSTCQKCRGVEA